MNKWNWLSLIVAMCALGATVTTTYWLHQVEFVPQEKRAEVRFALTQTASMLDRAIAFIKENPGNIGQKIAVTEAGKEFREGYTCYDNEQYDEALEEFRSARHIIHDAFPPEQIPSIYYPFRPYPEQF